MTEGDRTGGPGAAGPATRELVRAVRVHLDRVHDAVLRTGCSPEQAVEVVRDSALDLVDRAPGVLPADATHAVGEWFGDALARGRDAAGPDARWDPPGDDRQRRLSAALAALPEPDRTAVLLRDGYDLPATVVAAALGTAVDEAQDVVARARVALPGPDEGAEGQVRSLSGLAVTRLAEPARGQVLRAVEERAAQCLPAAAAPAAVAPVGAAAVEEVHVDAVAVDDPPPRLLSPLLAVLSVVLAVLAGVGIGLLLSTADDVEPLAGADGELPPGVVLVTPQPSPPDPPPSPPTVPEQRPDTRVVVVTPSPLPTPTPSPTPSPTPAPDPTLALSPASGPNGITVIVTGAGFAPGAQVRIDYLDTAGEPTGSGAVAVADDDGSLSTELAVQDPEAVPGPHDVVATAGDVTARATFTAQE